MLEKEVKIMLDEQEYALIEKAFGFSSEVMQVNHYYRSPSAAERRITVRVREIGGKALLQVKMPVSDKGSLAVREEKETELGSVPEYVPAELLGSICGIYENASAVGSLATLRKLCYDFEGIELALDRNEYLGVTDYELEAEYTGEYPDRLIDKLKELGIDTEKPAVGKYTRFCRKLAAEAAIS